MHEHYPLNRLRQFIFDKGGEDLPDTLNCVVYFFRNQLQYALKQDYELNTDAEEYNYEWNDDNQGFEVEIIYRNKNVKRFDSLESHVISVLRLEVKKELDLIEFLLLDKDATTKKTFALNVQDEVRKLITDVSEAKLGYSEIIIKSLDTLTFFLEKFGRNNRAKKLQYICRISLQSPAVSKFHRKLRSYSFLNCTFTEFRIFLESKSTTRKIVWEGTPTEFKAFIDKLCESRNNKQPYISFSHKSKWIELENIFQLKDNYPFRKIKTLKKPTRKINDYLEDCMYELDSTNL